MKELNGILIEKFNQYDLPESSRTSTCPICSKHRKKKEQKCLIINWSNGLANCQHCGELLQIHTYKKKEQNKPYKKPIFENNTNISDALVKWFSGRKISQNTLKLLKVTEGVAWMPQINKEINTVQFNYFRDNELINVKFRDGHKNFKLSKDAEKIPYNYDNCIASDYVIITEGEIDTMSYFEAGLFSACSTPNGSTLRGVNLEWLDNSYELFKNKEKIYLSIDNDEPGRNVQKELIRRLGAYRCFLIDLEDCNDANEYHVKYGAERLRRCVDNAKSVPLENVIILNDIKTDLHSFYKNGSPKGFTIGLEPFDKVFSTYTKQGVLVTGIPSHGKSDWVDQMAIGYNLNERWKGAFCSVENDPKYLHLDKLCRKIAGIRPRVEDLKTEKWQKVEDHVNDNFFFVDYQDGYDLTKVLLNVKELVFRKGIKFFVLDPFNKIKLKESSKKNINDYTNDYLLTIDNFAREHDLFYILVAHPVKMNKVNGITPEPDFYSVKGGGEFYDMMPHGISVFRDFERDLVKIKILKCKFQNLGQTGAEMYFKWNTINGRYTPIQNEVTEMTSIFNFEFNYNSLLEDNKKGITYDTGIEPNENPFEEIDEIPF